MGISFRWKKQEAKSLGKTELDLLVQAWPGLKILELSRTRELELISTCQVVQ